jgi:hypothetical protein
MKGKNWDMNIQNLMKRTEVVLEQIRKEYAEMGIALVTFDANVCNLHEVILTFPDGSKKIKNCKTNELRILP